MTKMVFGIGVYERGQYLCYVDGKVTKEYQRWNAMLSRCQPDGYYQRQKPTYVGCSAHPEFIHFQDFAAWCQGQIGFEHDDWQLDKDILIQDNKVYGPDTCVFVPRQINQVLTHKQTTDSMWPTGVSLHKNNVFKATIKICGVKKHIGCFKTPELAEAAYKMVKTNEVHRQAELWKSKIDPRVYEALLKFRI